jgi:hypothetical protein
LLLLTFEFTSAALPSDTPLPFATWRWDGADWLHLSTPTAPIYTTSGNPDHFVPYLTPLPNGAGLLYYAWARSGTSQTWTWDGTHWTEEHPVHTPVRGTFVTTPGPGAAPTIFLPERGIWRWTGSDWTKTERSGIGSNGDGFAVYDAHDSNVVVYANRAGYGLIYDTWTWDGTWTERVRSLSPPTTTRLATTTTIAPPTDPLPAGSVMLSTSGRTISAVDATGHVLKKLVTAFAGRSVMNAQLMADRQTIWYATKADDNQTCPEIVKLDLQTNARTVVAHALDFAITEDGSKLLLVYPYSNALVTNQCRPVPLAPGTSSYADDLSVRNLSTGAQSALPSGAYPSAGTGGPTGHVWISPSGEELVASNCVADGCVTMTFTVPKDLNGPIVPDRTKPGPKCGCSTLVSGPDGVYGVDEGSWNDARNFFRRYDATNLTGTGAEVLAPKSGTLGSVAPSAAGVFVTGRPTGSTTGVLYRVANGALEVVGPLATDVGHIYPIPPYVAG